MERTAKEIAAGISRLLRESKSLPESASKQTSGLSLTLTRKHLNELWRRMAQIYGHKWVSNYGTTDTDDTWRLVLCGVQPEQLSVGLRACAESEDDWPPTAPQFRRMCFGGVKESMPIEHAMIESDEVKAHRRELAREYRKKWQEMGLLRKNPASTAGQ